MSCGPPTSKALKPENEGKSISKNFTYILKRYITKTKTQIYTMCISQCILLFILVIVVAIIVWRYQLLSRHVSNPENYYLTDSPIHGKGVFAAKDYQKDEFVEVLIDELFASITTGFGNMINHSTNPTMYLKYNSQTNTYDCLAKNNVFKGVELTLDYNYNPWHTCGPEPHYK